MTDPVLPPPSVVWTMKSGSGLRSAQCEVQEQASGDLELRVHVDGLCVYSCVHGDLESITADAKRMAARMTRQGWVFDDPADSADAASTTP